MKVFISVKFPGVIVPVAPKPICYSTVHYLLFPVMQGYLLNLKLEKESILTRPLVRPLMISLELAYIFIKMLKP